MYEEVFEFDFLSFWSSTGVLIVFPTLCYLLICSINYYTTGIKDEEGSAERQARDAVPPTYAISAWFGFSCICLPVCVPPLLECGLIALMRYANSDQMRKKEILQGKVYLNLAKNSELIERFSYMTEAEKEQWYADYVKRVPNCRIPNGRLTKWMLIWWVIGLLLGIGFKALYELAA